MGDREDAEIERRSRAMVDAQRPLLNWTRRPTVEALGVRVDELERRVGELERREGRWRENGFQPNGPYC